MLSTIDHWLKLLTTLTGVPVILIPLLGFRRAQAHSQGRVSGKGARYLRWPLMLVLTALYVGTGVFLWRPLPIRLSPQIRVFVLALGSLLYFPAITLYFWGYRTLGRMFGISNSFGAALYLDHELVQSGPYHYTRHPMYLGVILAAFGALFIFRTWAMVLFSISSLGVIIRARREEKLLRQEFGEAWDAYKERVPGWLPALRKVLK